MSNDRKTSIYLVPSSNIKIKIVNDQWTLHGIEFSDCNCDYGCPCKFNAPTTYGFCEAVGSPGIDEENFNDISLDGVNCVVINPLSAKEMRARIHLPEVFDYTYAEMGSGSSNVGGAIPLELNNSYGRFCELHMNQDGVIR